jgi:REP element-mobilizing transposase RayT
MPHIKRPDHKAEEPVHVTLKSYLRSLRSQYVFPTVRGAIADSKKRWGSRFRVVHFSVQGNHIHMIAEATDRNALLQGVRGLSISIARRVNRLVFRRGTFWQDRWHSRPLTTPRAVRRAIVYVLANGFKHIARLSSRIDVFSSAPYFEGFRESPGVAFIRIAPRLVPHLLQPPEVAPVSTAESWLLRVGWRKLGLISVHERPLGCSRP